MAFTPLHISDFLKTVGRGIESVGEFGIRSVVKPAGGFLAERGVLGTIKPFREAFGVKPEEQLWNRVVSGDKAAIADAALSITPGAVGAIKPVIPKLATALTKVEGIKNAGKAYKNLFPTLRRIPREVGEKIPLNERLPEIQRQLTDRFAPVRIFKQRIERITGQKLSPSADPYIAARLFPGRYGKIENRLNEFGDIIKPVRKNTGDLSNLLIIERSIERAERGMKNPANLTLEEATAAKLELQQKLGDAAFKKLNDVAEGIYKFGNDKLLRYAREGGIINEALETAIKKLNKKYIPFDVLEYLDETSDALPRGKEVFSVARQNIINAMKGTEKDIADPLEAYVRKIAKTVNLVERNKVALKIADISKLGDEAAEMIIPVSEGTAIPQGYEKLHAIRDGVKEEYAIPRFLADTIKGLKSENIDIITKMASLGSRALRAGATTFNAAFLPSNAIRDFQTAKVVANKFNRKFSVADWVKGFASAIKQDDIYKQYLESGGSFSGFFSGEVKNIPQSVKLLTQPRSIKLAKTIINPVELIRSVGELIELAPRIGTFRRGLKEGSEELAAFQSREATVDFAKSGSVLRVVNMWIPFLNARLQGTLNLLQTLKAKPLQAMTTVSGLIGTPIISTYYWNTRRYGELYDEIPQFIKDNYFVLIVGKGKDEDGREAPQFIKLPKGDVGRVFGNPLESFLAFLDQNNKKRADQLALQIISDLSPISFEREGKFSAGAFVGGILPPTIKGVAESVTNTNLFTGLPIVPKRLQGVSPRLQFKEETSKIAKLVGDKLNLSPLKIENFIRAQFGTAGIQLIHVLGGDVGKAAETITKRFEETRGGETTRKDFDLVDSLLRESKDEKLLMRMDAERTYQEMKQLSRDDANQAFRELMRDNKELAEEVKQIKEDDAKGIGSFERFAKTLPIKDGTRAKFIVQKLNTLETKEEKNELLKQYKDQGILTPEVFKQLKKMKEKGLLLIPANPTETEK